MTYRIKPLEFKQSGENECWVNGYISSGGDYPYNRDGISALQGIIKERLYA